MKKLYFVTCFLLIFGFSYSQTVRLGEIYAKPGDTISVPLTAHNFKSIGAIGFYIKYDENVLKYLDVINLNPDINTMLYNNKESILRSGWYSPDAVATVNIDNTKLYDVRFIYKGGYSNLSFDTEFSIIANIEGENENQNTHYFDGFVNDRSLINAASEIQSGNVINIYPNPTSGIVNIIAFRGSNIKNVKVFNVDGMEIYYQDNILKASIAFDISNQPSGVYFLRIEGDNNVIYRKLIKKVL